MALPITPDLTPNRLHRHHNRPRPRSLELELLHLPQASGPHTPTAALRQTARMPGCASPVAVRDPGPLLRQLVRAPPGPLAQSLVPRMQAHIPEARAASQGSPGVSAAVNAAAAALILHNNLGEEAMDLVLGKVCVYGGNGILC